MYAVFHTKVLSSWIRNELKKSISMSILWLEPQSSYGFIMQE